MFIGLYPAYGIHPECELIISWRVGATIDSTLTKRELRRRRYRKKNAYSKEKKNNNKRPIERSDTGGNPADGVEAVAWNTVVAAFLSAKTAGFAHLPRRP